MLHRTTDHRALVDRFRWAVPDRFNIGSDVVDRHAAAGNRPALIFEDEAGRVTRLGFRDVALASNRFANVLVGLGLQRGDRVGILLSQGPETAIAHVAAYKAGLIAVPLFTLFGPEALEYRLGDSGARLLVTDEENAAKVEGIRDRLPGLAHIIRIDGGDRPFWNLLERASDRFATVDTAADDPALIIYTSGTTGPPKGALHAHRVLLGHLPGWNCRMISFRRRATCSGRRPIGPGSAGCSTCCCRPGTTACPCWPTAPASSIPMRHWR